MQVRTFSHNGNHLLVSDNRQQKKQPAFQARLKDWQYVMPGSVLDRIEKKFNAENSFSDPKNPIVRCVRNPLIALGITNRPSSTSDFSNYGKVGDKILFDNDGKNVIVTVSRSAEKRSPHNLGEGEPSSNGNLKTHLCIKYPIEKLEQELGSPASPPAEGEKIPFLKAIEDTHKKVVTGWNEMIEAMLGKAD